MKNIFVSRPNEFSPIYNSSVQRLEKLLKDRGMNPVTIGSTTYTNNYPIKAVKEEMSKCSGVIILGLPQTHIEKGLSKKGSKSEQKIYNKDFASPWNQIEAAMAYTLDLPIMIISEENIDDGLLGIGGLPVFRNMYNLRSYHWIERQSFLDPFNEWQETLKKN